MRLLLRTILRPDIYVHYWLARWYFWRCDLRLRRLQMTLDKRRELQAYRRPHR